MLHCQPLRRTTRQSTPAATPYTRPPPAPPTRVVLREEVALLLQARQLQQVLHELSVLVAEGGQDDNVVLHSRHDRHSMLVREDKG